MPADDDKHRGRARSQAEHPRNTPVRGLPAIPVPTSIAVQIAGPEVWAEELTQPGEPPEVTLARRAARQSPGEPLEAANSRRLERASIATTLTLQTLKRQDAELADLKAGHVVLAEGMHRVELAQVATATELKTLVKLASAADLAREQAAAAALAERAAREAVAKAESEAIAKAKAERDAREEARKDKREDQRFELSKLSIGRQVALVAAVLTGIGGIVAALVQLVQYVSNKGGTP